MGQSTFNRNRSILSWVDDVVALADHLKLDKFSIMGHSGGCPYVAACAFKIPERLRGAAIVSGFAPFEDPGSHIGMMKEQLIANKLVKRFPFLSSIMMRITRLMLMKSDKILDKMIKNLPAVDKIALTRFVGSTRCFKSFTENKPTISQARNLKKGSAQKML